MSDTCDVPLLEVLDSIPLNGRSVWMVSTTESRNIPYGNICQQAATRIRQLERELAEAKAEVERAKQDRNEAAMRERNKYLSQLTAQKAALEKCRKVIGDNHDPSCEIYWDSDKECNCSLKDDREEALSEIAKLKGPQ